MKRVQQRIKRKVDDFGLLPAASEPGHIEHADNAKCYALNANVRSNRRCSPEKHCRDLFANHSDFSVIPDISLIQKTSLHNLNIAHHKNVRQLSTHRERAFFRPVPDGIIPPDSRAGAEIRDLRNRLANCLHVIGSQTYWASGI